LCHTIQPPWGDVSGLATDPADLGLVINNPGGDPHHDVAIVRGGRVAAAIRLLVERETGSVMRSNSMLDLLLFAYALLSTKLYRSYLF
jgi:hypothetical protein